MRQRTPRSVVAAVLLIAGSLTLPFADPPDAVAATGADNLGLVDPATGLWYLHDAGGAVTEFFFGNPGDFPIAGDWDCDGIDTPGMYRQTDGYVYLRNSNSQGVADIKFFFGNPGDIPLAGDFNGDGCATVSIFRPAEGRVFIINALGSGDGGLGAADFDYYFGNPGDKPFVGDFDGDGVETIGLHRESTGLVYFNNEHRSKAAEHEFIYGDPGDRIVAGDWNNAGGDSPALFRPSTATCYFRHTNTQGNADHELTWGAGHYLPVSGRFFGAGGPGPSTEPDPGPSTEPDPAAPPPSDDELVGPPTTWGLVGASWDADSDDDLLSDGLEQWLVDTFKPYYVFDEEETDCLNPLTDVAVFTQVSPWHRWNWNVSDGHNYRRGVGMTFVASYAKDCGAASQSWLPSSIGHDHIGDTEAVWIYVLEDWAGTWWPQGISIKRHHHDPQWYEDYMFGYHPGTSHPRLYISESKHATYPNTRECETYTAWGIPFEDCGGGYYIDYPTPFSHNVGEHHAVLLDSLDPLFPGEYAWTSPAFCGGLNPGIYGGDCGGALFGKWIKVDTPNLNGWYYVTSVDRWYKIEWSVDHYEMWDHDQQTWLPMWIQGYDVGLSGTSIGGTVTAKNDATDTATRIEWNNGLVFELSQ